MCVILSHRLILPVLYPWLLMATLFNPSSLPRDAHNIAHISSGSSSSKDGRKLTGCATNQKYLEGLPTAEGGPGTTVDP